jgi:hypothetical protein
MHIPAAASCHGAFRWFAILPHCTRSFRQWKILAPRLVEIDEKWHSAMRKSRSTIMRKLALRVSVLVAVAVASGCNRQDADALSKIGQLLAQRAKALPINSTNKLSKVSTPPAPEAEKREEKVN